VPLFQRYAKDATSRDGDGARWMPFVSYACGHQLHLTCVRNFYTMPVSDKCVVCLGEMASAGQFGPFLRRLNGVLETTALAQQASGDTVEGVTCGINTGVAPALDLSARSNVEQALLRQREQRKRAARAAKQDNAAFDAVYKAMEDALSLEAQVSGDGADADHDSNERQHGEGALIREFFSLPNQTLWKFTRRDGGSLQMLVDRGATWEQLCQWGVGDLLTAEDAQRVGFSRRTADCGDSHSSRHAQVRELNWCGMPEVLALCRPPICLSFQMFFRDVCDSRFETMRKLRPDEELLIAMGFSFRTHNELVMLDPVGALRALVHVRHDTFTRVFDFTPSVCAQFKAHPDPAVMPMLRAKFTEWQMFT
jgi:hypothetical protein